MDYFEMIINLQKIEYGKILFIESGAFYIAVGADAIILNKITGLKLICAKRNICKVGIPKKSLNKYIEKVEQIGYGYAVIGYNKEKNEMKKIYEKPGKQKEISTISKNCTICERRLDQKETIYDKAIKKYAEREYGMV